MTPAKVLVEIIGMMPEKCEDSSPPQKSENLETPELDIFDASLKVSSTNSKFDFISEGI